AVVLAGVGVLWITWTTGVAPWLGLMLAVTFGLYGLIRKIAPLGSLEGMVLESLLLTPAAAAWLWFLWSDHELAFISADLTTQILLVAAGPVTAVPLLFFASGVRRIPYSTSAVIQYVSPTMVFLIGVFAFGEPFSKGMLVGFLIIWAAVALFLGEMLLFARRCRNEAREAADRV
ncbi:EamA family transporter, partial [Sutterella wadsworthensis]